MAYTIENLLSESIPSTAEGIKILAATDLPQVKEILEGNRPLPEGCPSRASAAEFALRGLNGRVDEITTLLNELNKLIWAQYKGKK